MFSCVTVKHLHAFVGVSDKGHERRDASPDLVQKIQKDLFEDFIPLSVVEGACLPQDTDAPGTDDGAGDLCDPVTVAPFRRSECGRRDVG